MKSEIIEQKYNFDLSLGIKPQPAILLDISNHILNIDKIFEKKQYMIIDGIDESGKTTISSDYTRYKNSFSVFFSKFNKGEFNLDYILENLIPQIANYLSLENEIKDFSIETFRRLQNKLRAVRRETFYFVIDGLEHSSNVIFVDEVLELVNLDVINFRFLFTDNNFITKRDIFKKLDFGINNVIGFGINEIKIYFKEFNLLDENIKIIHSFSNGIPSRLKIIKERLQESNNFNSLEIADKFENWLEQDIEKDLSKINQKKIEDYNLYIALISLSDGSFSLNDIAVGFDEELDKVKDLFSSLSRIFTIDNSNVSFTSNIYKEIFKKKYSLLNDKIKSIEIKINYEQPEIRYKTRLVEILFKDKNYSKILNVFEDNFIANAFSQIQNISQVNDLIDKVCKSSFYLNKNQDLFNYSVQGSIINDIENDIENENKILSLISLEEYDKAIVITDLLLSNKNKLLYYGKIAKYQKEKRKIIDDVLIDKIDLIFNTLELADYGNDLHEIVSDLISISSKYALSILNMGEGDENVNINELLFAKLSLAVLNNSEEQNDSKFTDVLSKIENDKTKQINSSLRLFIGKYSFERLNEEILNYKDPKERIKLYRLWLENSEDKDNITIVITNVVDEIINSDSNDIFNLEILSEISAHIYKIQNYESKFRIAERFKNLLGEVEDKGLFINKTTFNLNLFNCYYNKDINNQEAINILINLLEEINAYPDLLIKCEALMLTLEYIFEKVNYLGQIKTNVINSFDENFENLLLETSDQYTPFRKILKSISKTNFQFCEKLLNKLNTTDNRDKSRLYVIDQYLNQDYLKINIDSILNFKNSFHEVFFENVVDRMILVRFCDLKNLNEFFITKLKQVCLTPKNIISSYNKIYFKILLLKTYYNSNENKNYNKNISHLKKLIKEELSAIQDSYKKNSFCQFIASRISLVDKGFAKEIFSENTTEDVMLYNNLRYKITYLLIKNFEAIIKANKKQIAENSISKIHEEFFNNIIERIKEINDSEDSLKLFTRLGFICYLNNLENQAKEIYHNVFESLNIIIKREPVYEYLNSLTYVYLYNQSFVISQSNILTNRVKEELYFDLCNFYLFKQNPYDLYDSKNCSFDCNYTDISNCLISLENMTIDLNIYNIIEKISRLSNHKNLKLPTLQLNEITDKISNIIKTKLPDPSNISHEGYKVISKIRFQKLYKKYDLSDIKNEIDSIKNISDKIFVKSALIEEFSSFKGQSLSKESIFNEILEDFKIITNNYEFINRVNDLSEIMFKFPNNKRWKDLVSSAFDLSIKLENKTNSVKYQNRIIDTIYKLDDDLAKDLVSRGIDDSRKTISNLIKIHYENLKDVNALSQKTEIINDNVNVENYIKSLLDNLKDLNSNLVKAKKIIDLKSVLITASKLPLDKSIIMYDYYFKNIASANYSKEELEKTLNTLNANIKSIFNSDLIINSIGKIKESKYINISDSILHEDNNIIIKGTERNKAIEIFKNWIIEESNEFLYIIDPYFNAKDVEFLYTIHKCDKNIEIKVLCCKYFEQEEVINEWKKITKDEIENCEIIFTYFRSNSEQPIHDRYLISENSGLRLGTSINSIGSSNKFSEISKMSKQEVKKLLSEEINGFILGKKKEVNGEKLDRRTYNL